MQQAGGMGPGPSPTGEEGGGPPSPAANENTIELLNSAKTELLKEGNGIDWKQKALDRVVEKLKTKNDLHDDSSEAI